MKIFKLIGVLLSFSVLASCTNDSSTETVDANVIIATVAADFSSGAHTVISKDENGDRVALNELLPTASDITIASFGKHFYRIERAFAGNNITKFSASDPQTPIWQYSTNDAGSAVLSNPHDMIFVSETKAYILRYGSSAAWIVNPSAKVEADFKIGELDLSAYDDVPEMDGGVIVDGKLYITLQRLDGFAVTQNAYIAIFDVETDEEIDANIAGDSLKGIPLQTRNPTNIIYESNANVIYVQGSGSFFPEEFTGGIEKIDLVDLNTTVIVDDGDAIDHPYGLITELAVASENVLYFVGYAGFTDNTLYKLDLETAEITATNVASLINGQIAYLTVDSGGSLWVSDSANATVRIIDPVADVEIDVFSTSLNPEKIVFAE
jgi:hypothetical protein